MSSSAEELAPVPDRVIPDVAAVRHLVNRQFPQWADLEIRPVANGGWDNVTFHLGDEFSVRLPSAAPYALAVEKEARWLPELAPLLPLPIPEQVAVGVPDVDFPHPWTVQRWLPGRTVTREAIADLADFAESLATFVAALQAIEPGDGPRPGLHNWYRGGSLDRFAGYVDSGLELLGNRVDATAIRRSWRQSVQAGFDGVERWFHGDLAKGNLLLDESGALSAVIDFGACGVGDPACDLAIAWTILDESTRPIFRETIGVDDATWLRGRGWALWKMLATWAGSIDADGQIIDRHEHDFARRAVVQIEDDSR